MYLRFEFSGGDGQLDMEFDTHPIFQSQFVVDALESNNDDDDDEQVRVVPLPENISYSSMEKFIDFLTMHIMGDVEMGFGKHYSSTYLHVLTRERDYYEWGNRQLDPSDYLKRFLDWCEFYQGGCKPDSPEEIVPLAKFFQIDICLSLIHI